jgi:hypothetical protein
MLVDWYLKTTTASADHLPTPQIESAICFNCQGSLEDLEMAVVITHPLLVVPHLSWEKV